MLVLFRCIKRIFSWFKPHKTVATQDTNIASVDLSNSDVNYQLLRQPIKYVFDYPLPKDSQISLKQWLNDYGLPRDRATTIRLLAVYGKRLPSVQELRAYQGSADVLVWVRDVRDRLFALKNKQLLIPRSDSYQRLAILTEP